MLAQNVFRTILIVLSKLDPVQIVLNHPVPLVAPGVWEKSGEGSHDVGLQGTRPPALCDCSGHRPLLPATGFGAGTRQYGLQERQPFFHTGLR